MIVGVVITNGRDECLRRTIQAMRVHLPKLSGLIMVDDTGDEAHNAYLRTVYPGFRHVAHEVNKGMAAAVQSGWQAALETPATHIFHLEDDMELIAPVPLDMAVHVLRNDNRLAQMLFRRQALNDVELAEGGVLEAIVKLSAFHRIWPTHTTHDHIFSLNPCLIPRHIIEMGWPSGPLGVGNETGMTRKLLDAGYLFACWGQPGDNQIHVEHIGHERAEQWRL